MKNLNEPVAVRRANTPSLPGAAPGNTPLGKPEKAGRTGAESEYLDEYAYPRFIPRVPVLGDAEKLKRRCKHNADYTI